MLDLESMLDRQDVINKLATQYHRLTVDAVMYLEKSDRENYSAVMSHRFGVRLASESLKTWDDVYSLSDTLWRAHEDLQATVKNTK